MWVCVCVCVWLFILPFRRSLLLYYYYYYFYVSPSKPLFSRWKIRHIQKNKYEENNKKYSESEESVRLSIYIYISPAGVHERDQCLMLCPRQRDWKREREEAGGGHGRSPIRSTAPHKSTLTDEKGRTLREHSSPSSSRSPPNTQNVISIQLHMCVYTRPAGDSLYSIFSMWIIPLKKKK